MEIRLYNQWEDSVNIYLINFALHNCGGCAGFDLYLLGFGFALRFNTNGDDNDNEYKTT